MNDTITRAAKAVLLVLLLAYSGTIVVDLVGKVSRQEIQWDFTTYYYAAKAYREDLDPYEIENLRRAAGSNVGFPFAYPPPSLWFFKLFTLFPYHTAHYIWLIFKFALLVMLVLLWRKYFLPHHRSVLFYPFLLLAFDAAIYWDFKAGNVSLVEQFLIWLAFLYLLKKRPLVFCALVVPASLFKVTFIFFLGLLPLSGVKRGWKYLAGTCAVLVIVIGVWYAADPELFRSYLAGPGTIDERAEDFNYAMLPFLQDFFGSVTSITGLSLPQSVPVVVYLLFAGLVLFATGKTLKWKSPARLCQDPRLLILLSCVIYFLVMPRMKCYSCIIMVVPAYFIMMEYVNARAYPFIFLLLILTVHKPLPQYDLIKYYALYYLLYMGIVVWILYLYYIKDRLSAGPGREPEFPGTRDPSRA